MVTVSQDPSVPNAALAHASGRGKVSLPVAAPGSGSSSGARAAATLSLGPALARQAVQTSVAPTASASGVSSYRLNLLA